MDLTFSSAPLYVLGQTHIHELEDNIKLAILVLNSVGLHHIWAVRSRILALHLVKLFEDLYFSLMKSLFLRGILLIELFNRKLLTSFDLGTFVDLAETT